MPFSAGGRPSFYSHENAPGIVMAVGNTGEFLEFAADAMCTWLSRDGGATWEDVAPNAGKLALLSYACLPVLRECTLLKPTSGKPCTYTGGDACCHQVSCNHSPTLQGIYEYGDHGGLLILASHETEGPTDSLKFSLDQGACWHTIRLEEAIDIQNIRWTSHSTECQHCICLLASHISVVLCFFTGSSQCS